LRLEPFDVPFDVLKAESGIERPFGSAHGGELVEPLTATSPSIDSGPRAWSSGDVEWEVRLEQKRIRGSAAWSRDTTQTGWSLPHPCPLPAGEGINHCWASRPATGG